MIPATWWHLTASYSTTCSSEGGTGALHLPARVTGCLHWLAPRWRIIGDELGPSQPPLESADLIESKSWLRGKVAAGRDEFFSELAGNLSASSRGQPNQAALSTTRLKLVQIRLVS